jgi:hypothetical protein
MTARPCIVTAERTSYEFAVAELSRRESEQAA